MPLQLPPVNAQGIPKAIWDFIMAIKKAVIITKQDLIDYNLIDKDGNRINDSGDAINE